MTLFENAYFLTHVLPWTYPAHAPNGASIGLGVFAQLTAEIPYTIEWAAPFPLKIAVVHGGSRPPSNKCFLEPTRVHNPNGILISLAVLHGSRT